MRTEDIISISPTSTYELDLNIAAVTKDGQDRVQSIRRIDTELLTDTVISRSQDAIY